MHTPATDSPDNLLIRLWRRRSRDRRRPICFCAVDAEGDPHHNRFLGVVRILGAISPLLLSAPLYGQIAIGQQDLQFGNVLPGIPTAISRLDALNAGHFRIQGTRRADVRIDFTLPGALIGGGGANLTVQFGSSDGGQSTRSNINTSTPFDPTLPLLTTLSNQGRLFLWLGGTALPTPIQSSGSYGATITLTVSYTGT